MSTDFFTSQDHARRQTGKLVLLFAAGVVATMASMWFVLAMLLSGSQGPSVWTDPMLALGVFIVIGGIVGAVTLVKLGQLSMGGEKIAQMLGGRRIDPATRNPSERQLLNIVEEMSIASGVPVPPVYLMEDRSVNAFAAGPDPSRSVIGVTRGCMELLSRDELQGVVAHEYSHIFHGDTRINARTTAVIAGIMAVGLLGYVLFRFIGPTLARSGGGRNNPGPAIGLGLIVLGLAVWGIGSLGMLFGRLIQAAISRQREFLADAAAVQYTRNPDGIAGALAKIRDHYSARIESPAASELNHFFFATSLNTMFATHPPIDERIRRIVAMGAVKVGAAEARATAPGARRAAAPTRAGHPPAVAMAGFAGASQPAPPPPPPDAAAAISHAGTLDADAIARAHDWVESLPRELLDACHEASGARAILYALLQASGQGVGQGAGQGGDLMRRIATRDPEAHRRVPVLAPLVARLREDRRIALVDLCGPALHGLGRAGYAAFRDDLAQLMRADGRVDLNEWAIAKSLERHVERRFAPKPARATARLEDLGESVRMVLGIIAGIEHDGAGAIRAFNRAYAEIRMPAPTPPEVSQRTLDALDAAVKRLAEARFTERERLLAACAAAALHEGDASAHEHLVVRAVADALDVPIPALAA